MIPRNFDNMPEVLQDIIIQLVGVGNHEYSNLKMFKQGTKLVGTRNGLPCTECYLEGVKHNSLIYTCVDCEIANLCGEDTQMVRMNWEDFVNHPVIQQDLFIRAHAPNGFEHLRSMIYHDDCFTRYNRGCINYEIARKPLNIVYKPVFKYLKH